jgi:hypothetical protein
LAAKGTQKNLIASHQKSKEPDDWQTFINFARGSLENTIIKIIGRVNPNSPSLNLSHFPVGGNQIFFLVPPEGQDILMASLT